MKYYEAPSIFLGKNFLNKNSYQDVIHYIRQNSSIDFTGCANVKSIESAAREMQSVAKKFNQNSGNRIKHFVISFSDNGILHDPFYAHYVGVEICKFFSSEYQIVFAVHPDVDETRIHFVMNQISYIDGHRYSEGEHDLYFLSLYLWRLFRSPLEIVKVTG